jgi:hypothetical protein
VLPINGEERFNTKTRRGWRACTCPPVVVATRPGLGLVGAILPLHSPLPWLPAGSCVTTHILSPSVERALNTDPPSLWGGNANVLSDGSWCDCCEGLTCLRGPLGGHFVTAWAALAPGQAGWGYQQPSSHLQIVASFGTPGCLTSLCIVFWTPLCIKIKGLLYRLQPGTSKPYIIQGSWCFLWEFCRNTEPIITFDLLHGNDWCLGCH